jgi:hypothetical protein
MNFAIYMLGALLVIIGLGYAAYILGVSPTWIGIGVLVILGLSIMAGIGRTWKGPSPK